jgi:formylglycine-generating enzyme required for sulfatase activity
VAVTDAERAKRIAELFEGALDREPADRGPWLAEQCAGDEPLRAEVEALLAADAEDAPTLMPSGASFAEALATPQHDPWVGRTLGPWTLEETLGEGGMGRVYRARRSEGGFEQRAAVKLLRTSIVTAETLARFSHERATLARLEHPGIARLLDGGTTDDGVPWLAMELVEGMELDAWADSRRLDVDGRIALAASVCDAVAYAHTNLVVHRDLKPSNVLVGEDGTPRLLDFGIAKVLDDELSPGLTAEGGAPRTPGYASPEQLRGAQVGTPSDVYSLGVLVHELLTGASPHSPANDTIAALVDAVCTGEATRPSKATTLDAAARGTTEERLRRRLAGDLDNVVLKALEKEPERRYASAADLADDLRRHLDGLPVAARAPTFAYRTSRFVARHRVACVLGAALLLVALAAAANAIQSMLRDQDQLLAIRRLSDGRRLTALRLQSEQLWPPRPDKRQAMVDWLGEADVLLQHLPGHADTLAALHVEVAAGSNDQEVLWWHEELSALVAELETFAIEDPWGDTAAAMAARLELVDEIERLSQGEAADAWASAREAIAASPHYDGLDLPPQWALVPWREDPASGLWQFWVAGTGAPPTAPEGSLVVGEETAIVLVLLPGGTATVGAQGRDNQAIGYDPLAYEDEAPPHAAWLDPFFLAATELTQGQWERLTGARPSKHQPPVFDVFDITLAHPVEQVSFDDALEALSRRGLQLPTEVQWEYAARAGTTTPWSHGSDPSRLEEVANLLDLFARDNGGSSGWNYEPASLYGLNDGYLYPAPVAHFAPNGFGLHDVHGNVWEWTADQPAPYFLETVRGDGARVIPDGAPDGDKRVLRGGAFSNPPDRVRSAKRWSAVREFRSLVVGARPSRAIQR